MAWITAAGGILTARDGAPSCSPRSKENSVLLIIAIVLLVVAIAGGAIVHPGLFLLALIAIAVYFNGR